MYIEQVYFVGNRQYAQAQPLNSVLYVKQSDYVAFSEVTQSFTAKLKYGLFSSKSYEEDDRIAIFLDGELIDCDEKNRRSEQGLGGYIVGINENKFLDFRKSRMENLCFASCANSALPTFPLRHIRTDAQAFMNMYLCRYWNKATKKWEISYKAMNNILPNVELFGDYLPDLNS
jgi:hypothetical protein